MPTEVDGKISNLRNVTDTALTVGDPWHDNPSLKNFAPRLGWPGIRSARAGRRCAAGFGIFHDEILPKYYFFSGSLNPPFTTRTSIANPPFPNVIANFDSERLDPRAAADGERRSADAVHHAVQRQRAARAPGDWDVMVGYVGSRGRNLLRLGDANLAPETIVNGVKTYQPQPGAAIRTSPASGSA